MSISVVAWTVLIFIMITAQVFTLLLLRDLSARHERLRVETGSMFMAMTVHLKDHDGRLRAMGSHHHVERGLVDLETVGVASRDPVRRVPP